MKIATKTRRFSTWKHSPPRQRRSPLVQGGQGRSGRDVEDSAGIVGLCLVGAIVLIAAGLALSI